MLECEEFLGASRSSPSTILSGAYEMCPLFALQKKNISRQSDAGKKVASFEKITLVFFVSVEVWLVSFSSLWSVHMCLPAGPDILTKCSIFFQNGKILYAETTSIARDEILLRSIEISGLFYEGIKNLNCTSTLSMN